MHVRGDKKNRKKQNKTKQTKVITYQWINGEFFYFIIIYFIYFVWVL